MGVKAADWGIAIGTHDGHAVCRSKLADQPLLIDDRVPLKFGRGADVFGSEHGRPDEPGIARSHLYWPTHDPFKGVLI
jgi:hypothetical protein